MNTRKDSDLQWGFSLKHPRSNNLLFSQVLLNTHFKFHVSKIPFSTTRIFTGNKTWWFIHVKHVPETFVTGVFSTELVSLSDLGISPKIHIHRPKSQKSTQICRLPVYYVHLLHYFKIAHLLTELHLQVPWPAYFGPNTTAYIGWRTNEKKSFCVAIVKRKTHIKTRMCASAKLFAGNSHTMHVSCFEIHACFMLCNAFLSNTVSQIEIINSRFLFFILIGIYSSIYDLSLQVRDKGSTFSRKTLKTGRMTNVWR